MADNDGDSDEARARRPLLAVECPYRMAFGPRAGQNLQTVLGVMPRFKRTPFADINGLTL